MSPLLAEAPALPALVEGEVTHSRRTQTRHAFRHAVYQWLVDLDDVPVQRWWLRPFAGFRAQDHLGDPRETIKANVVQFARLHSVEVTGRVVMLANARVLGHVFDPLSVFWCHDRDGALVCIVAEVHNTYGERHAYLLRPDEHGLARADKEFYVSPFFSVEGGYDLRMTLAPARVSTSIVLHQGGAPVFAASFVGRPRPATTRRLLSLLLRHPLMPQRVSVLIRLHGVVLWLKRLPVIHRATHTPPEGVS
ncbi:MAG: DUF1365 domain-containing protein [Actinomycetota bacterium]|nr:DUF1365 domain-containing protein [Actinomycetota bacterium]